MALSDVIGSFVTHSALSVTRSVAGTYTNGRWVPGSTSAISIDACIQPMSGREIEFLPEAHRAQEVKKLYTTTELFTVRTDTPADTVTVGGELYTVISVSAWGAFGGNSSGDHYECLIARVPAP